MAEQVALAETVAAIVLLAAMARQALLATQTQTATTPTALLAQAAQALPDYGHIIVRSDVAGTSGSANDARH